MNVHHLELFFYVAKFEGITAAVRKMPYGIQQPALSGQLLQLEKNLGLRLFHRRPFALTPEGEKLYDYVYPFFSKMGEMEESLKGREQRHLRVAASASVLRNHLPAVLEKMRDQEPDLRLSLKEIEPQQIGTALDNQEADVGITLLEGTITKGQRSMLLMKLPPVLLVPNTWKEKKLADLLTPDEWEKGTVGTRDLIALPSSELLRRNFEKELTRQQIVWEPTMEVNSLDLIRDYTQRGFGVGLGLSIPGITTSGLREVPLKGFPSLEVHAVTRGAPKPLVLRFLKIAQDYVKELG